MTQRLLRRGDVETATGLSRSTLYLLLQRGEFPRPVKITGKAVAWHQSEIDDWITTRAKA